MAMLPASFSVRTSETGVRKTIRSPAWIDRSRKSALSDNPSRKTSITLNPFSAENPVSETVFPISGDPKGINICARNRRSFAFGNMSTSDSRVGNRKGEVNAR